MRRTIWLTAGIIIFFTLIIGMVGFFGLIVALNGFTESTGTAILLSYLVLLLLLLLLSVPVSRWGMATATTYTGWPVWIVAPLTILGTTIAIGVMLMLGSITLMLALG